MRIRNGPICVVRVEGIEAIAFRRHKHHIVTSQTADRQTPPQTAVERRQSYPSYVKNSFPKPARSGAGSKNCFIEIGAGPRQIIVKCQHVWLSVSALYKKQSGTGNCYI